MDVSSLFGTCASVAAHKHFCDSFHFSPPVVSPVYKYPFFIMPSYAFKLYPLFTSYFVLLVFFFFYPISSIDVALETIPWEDAC